MLPFLPSVHDRMLRLDPTEAAETTQLRETVFNQSRIIIEKREQIQQLATQVHQLSEGMARPNNPAPVPGLPATIPAIPKPGVYLGDPEACKGFFLQSKMYFESISQHYGGLQLHHISNSAYRRSISLWASVVRTDTCLALAMYLITLLRGKQ